jgi:hypothetical protein
MTDLSDNLTTDDTKIEPGNNRRDLFRKIAIVGAGAAVGSAVLSNRADAAVNPVQTDSTAAAAAPTIIVGPPTAALTDKSFFSVQEAATGSLPLFPAAVGGYAADKIPNGLHGSTTSLAGFGVVAANAATPDAAKDAPKALALGSFGSHIQFLTAKSVATAAGITPVPADVVGPSVGKHGPGEMYVDDKYNLWFSVPGAATTDPVRWVRLAGSSTAGSFVALPSPVRSYDSREGTVGKIKFGEERVIDLTKGKKGTATIEGIPAGASAAAFNLTIDATTEFGFLSAFADGATFNDTSNINWAISGIAVANYVVSAVSSAGKIRIRGGGPAGSTHFIIDTTGYYL